jgi:accessory gene regulator B
MLQKVALNLTDHLQKMDIVSEEDREIYIYGFEAMLSTLLNTLIILAIGIFTGLIPETIVFLIAFAILRVYCGGYHAKTHLGCILTFALFYGLAMTILTFFPLRYAGLFSTIIGAASVLFIFKYAPIEHKNRTFEGNEYKNFRMMSRILAAAEMSVIIIILRFFPDLARFSLTISISMLCVVFILAFAKIIERKR